MSEKDNLADEAFARKQILDAQISNIDLIDYAVRSRVIFAMLFIDFTTLQEKGFTEQQALYIICNRK